MKSAPAIAFDHSPSRIVRGALIAVAALAALAPWFSVLATPACMLASAFIMVGAWFALRRFDDRRFRRIACGDAGWRLLDADNVEHAAILQSHTRLGACIALIFRFGPRQRFAALLLPDNCERDTHRRLLLLLAASAEVAVAR